jgi:diguanylate cyclase (GGDEF)-like protein
MAEGPLEQKKSICVMIGDVSYDFTNELMDGMNEAAEREGVRVFYMTGKQKHADPIDTENEHVAVSNYNSIYDYVKLVGADAHIISCGSLSGFANDKEYLQFVKRFSGTPFLLLHEELKFKGPRSSSISIDNYNSVCQCAEHLILVHGYKRIAFISGPKDHPDGKVRERAYRDTMKKHNLPVEKGMVPTGDLSGFITKEVTKLLLDYPDLEAIMLCNDEMARTCYRVLSDHGLRVGRDIAVTGFDNFTTGRTLTPPLTTISQNAFRSGNMAVTHAIALAEGKHVEPIRLETSLRIRNSCGCANSGNAGIFSADAKSGKEYLDDVIAKMRADLLQMYSQDWHENLTALIWKLMDYVISLVLKTLDAPLDEQETDTWLAEYAREVNWTGALIARRLHSYLIQAPDAPSQEVAVKLQHVLLYIQGFLFSYKASEADKRFEAFRSQAWFVPEFIRDLVVLGKEDEDEGEGVFRSVVERLRSIGLDKVYICLLPESQTLRESNLNKEPDKVLLAAYLSGDVSMAYPRSRMPVFDRSNPLRNLPDLESDAHLITFSIFSGDVQFGILLCEANREIIPILHVIGLQLGILINFLDLKHKERVVISEMEHIRERIEILNFLSDYDALCNIFNRRGFIERAIHMNRENAGKRAFCAFIDMDHLKEINDTFGHAAGDDALVVISDILKKSVRNNDLIARLGGDEFVGMFITDSPSFQQDFRTRLKDAFDEYNRKSDKLYMVEVSMGIAEFTCTQGMEISLVINEADRSLYKAKDHKCKNVLKQPAGE